MSSENYLPMDPDERPASPPPAEDLPMSPPPGDDDDEGIQGEDPLEKELIQEAVRTKLDKKHIRRQEEVKRSWCIRCARAICTCGGSCCVRKPFNPNEFQVQLSAKKEHLHEANKPYGHAQMFFPDNGTSSPQLTVGPVVGFVNHDTARIMVEANVTQKITMLLVGQDGALHDPPHETTKTIAVSANRPTIFHFTDLRPSYRYEIYTNVQAPRLAGAGFRTAKSPTCMLDQVPFKFAIVNGDKVETWQERVHLSQRTIERTQLHHATKESLWEKLYKEIMRGNVHVVFHCGNNISIGGYTDTHKDAPSPFHEALHGDSSGLYEACQEEFRKIYRQAYSEQWRRHCLANCSNVMLMGELDIANMVPRQSTESEWALAESAHDVVCEYQRALLRDHEPHENRFREFEAFRIAPQVGVLCVDFRCPITFGSKKPHRPHVLGRDQLRIIKQALERRLSTTRDTHARSDISALIVVTNHPLGEKGSYVHMGDMLHEVDSFLHMLFQWRDHQPHHRQAFVVSGCGKQWGGLTVIKPPKSMGLAMNKLPIGQIATNPISAHTKRESGCCKPRNQTVFNIKKKLTTPGTNQIGICTVGTKYAYSGRSAANFNKNEKLGLPVMWSEIEHTEPTKDIHRPYKRLNEFAAF